MWYQNIFLFDQNKFIFNKVDFYGIKICFHSIKINFYSIKYICMVSKYILFNQNKFQFNKIYLWYQYIFLFSQNKFVFKKKRFYYITYFHPIKIFLYYMNFSFDTFLVTISDLSLSRGDKKCKKIECLSVSYSYAVTICKPCWEKSSNDSNKVVDAVSQQHFQKSSTTVLLWIRRIFSEMTKDTTLGE